MSKHTPKDDNEWEEVQIEARPSGSSAFSFRLPTPEFHALCDAAKDAKQSVSEYIRTAIRQHTEPRPVMQHSSFSVGNQYLAVERMTTWTENVARQESHIEINMQVYP